MAGILTGSGFSEASVALFLGPRSIVGLRNAGGALSRRAFRISFRARPSNTAVSGNDTDTKAHGRRIVYGLQTYHSSVIGTVGDGNRLLLGHKIQTQTQNSKTRACMSTPSAQETGSRRSNRKRGGSRQASIVRM